MESFLSLFREPAQELFVSERTLHKNFREPFSLTIIAHSLEDKSSFTLMVKNATNELAMIVILSSQAPFNEKGKAPMNQQTNNNLDAMKFVIWNTRRVNSVNFKCQCLNIVNTHRSSMLVLLETKMKEHKPLCDAFSFDLFIHSSVVGLMDGLAVMWRDGDLHLDNLISTPQGIHVVIKVLDKYAPGSSSSPHL
ncbi:uncharacterized protein LOC124897710 [Capsicum annuum]|uniref:uncharacterized protein LOC124897710 n=1 Tax=Capsicum annuum TaxID=4072 RepID=UPI001FB14302|nr:uncharacterized protein LOC124897710 [Capsicum annuum]